MIAAVAVAAIGSDSAASDPTPLTRSTHAVGWHVRDTQRVARLAWQRDAEPKPSRIGRLRWNLAAVEHPPADRKMVGIWRHQRKIARDRRYTPYDCGEYGYYAIPCYIVACESGYRDVAYNPSGAAGPYQIMASWGRPWPIRSRADRIEHDRIAAAIWNGGAGAGNWVCA